MATKKVVPLPKKGDSIVNPLNPKVTPSVGKVVVPGDKIKGGYNTMGTAIQDPNKIVSPAPSTVINEPVLNDTNPQYVALIQKGYTPEQISNAWKTIQEKQKPVTPPVAPKVEKQKVEVKKEVTTPTTTATTTVQGEPSYTDISPERQKQIIDNLEGYFAQNPNSFNNFETFKQNYSFDKRVPQQQIWLKNRYDSKKDAIATNSANQVKLTSLTNLNDASLANISSADAVFLMNNDPTAYLRYQKAKTDKDNLDLINGTPILNKIIEEANANKGPDYEAFINERNAELLPLSTEIAGLKTTYENMKNQYDNILADTQKQYQGETSAFVNAMAAKRQREILPQLQQAQTEYNNKAMLYNQQKALLDEEFDMQVKQQEVERNDLATKLALYEAQYGSFGERAKYGTTAGTEKVLTQDFGTSKKPDWRQSLDGGLTRQPIAGIYGGGTSAGGGAGGGGSGGIQNIGLDLSSVDPKKRSLANLIYQYKTLLDNTTRGDLQTNANLQSQKSTLKGLITAEYKKAMTLGTLDLGVQKLMDAILGAGGLTSVSTYSNKAQSNSAKMFLESIGGKINETVPENKNINKKPSNIQEIKPKEKYTNLSSYNPIKDNEYMTPMTQSTSLTTKKKNKYGLLGKIFGF